MIWSWNLLSMISVNNEVDLVVFLSEVTEGRWDCFARSIHHEYKAFWSIHFWRLLCHFEKSCNFYNTCNISYKKIHIIEKFSLPLIILLDAGPNGNYYQRKKSFLTLLQRPYLPVSIQHISRPEMDLLHFFFLFN